MAFTIAICMGARGHYTDYNHRFSEMGMELCRAKGKKARALVGPPGFEPGTNRL
jgi:hypothetical protein